MSFDFVTSDGSGPLSNVVSRRRVLTAGIAIGGGLLIGFKFGFAANVAQAPGLAPDGEFAPNAFIRIDRDSRVAFIVPEVEMGQGTFTSMPMLIAEELGVDLVQVHVEPAPANATLYGNPALASLQATGGSTSVRAGWFPLRRAGATARTMLIAVAATRMKVSPSACHAAGGEVIHAASGRKIKYGALAADAALLPVPANVTLKHPADFKLIGTSAKRLDAPLKVNGTAIYGIDVRLPGMKIVTFAASPVFGGRLKSVQSLKAEAVHGVRKIIQLDDAVAVVADHMGAALKGLAALDVHWDDGPNATLNSADIVRDLEAASRNPGAVARSQGDAVKAMASALTKIKAVYQVPFLAHATMEPMNCTVDLHKDHCEIWVGTQVIGRAQEAAAKTAGLPVDKVTVHNHFIGGGFGRRLEIDGVVRAVQIAKQFGGPIKVVWTREEDIQHDMYRPYFYDRLEAGLDTQGMPVGWSHRITGPSIMARFLPPAFAKGFDPDTVDGAATPPYDLPNISVEYVRQEPPGIPTAFWRGVGPTHNIYVVESFIDELAAAANKDPVAYRSALLHHDPRAKAVLKLVAAKSGWGKPLPARQGRGVSVQFAFGSYMAQVAEVEVSNEGAVRVKRVVCAVDCGIVVNPDTVRAQAEGAIIFGITAALYGEITLKAGRVEQSNFDTYQILRMNEAPVIEVHIVKSTETPGGMGEPGTSALAPAVTNAVFAATGKRIRKLPVDPKFLKHV